MGNCSATLQPIRKLPWRMNLTKTYKLATRFRRTDGKHMKNEGPVTVDDLKKFDGQEVGFLQHKKEPLPFTYTTLKIKKVSRLVPSSVHGGGAAPVLSMSVRRQEEINGKRRVKVVVTKKQLKKILSSANMSLEDMLSDIQKKRTGNCVSTPGWKPQLETIPEGGE